MDNRVSMDNLPQIELNIDINSTNSSCSLMSLRFWFVVPMKFLIMNDMTAAFRRLIPRVFLSRNKYARKTNKINKSFFALLMSLTIYLQFVSFGGGWKIANKLQINNDFFSAYLFLFHFIYFSRDAINGSYEFHCKLSHFVW